MQQKMGSKRRAWRTLLGLACVQATACGAVSSDERWEADALAVEATESSTGCDTPELEPTEDAGAGNTPAICSPSPLAGYGYAEAPSIWLGAQSAGKIGVQGPGYFVALRAGNQPVMRFSMEADLFVGPDGTLEDGRGHQLLGYASDEGSAGCLGTLRAPAAVPPTPTSRVFMRMNLDARSPVVRFDREDASGTSNQSVSFSIFDSRGEPRTLDAYFLRVDDLTWDYHALVDGSDLEGGTPGEPVEIGQGRLRFTGAGALASVLTPAVCASFAGSLSTQCLSMDFGTPTADSGNGLSGTTSFAASSEVLAFSTDGTAAGSAVFVVFDPNGLATAFFDNGTSVPFGKLALARFPRERDLAEQSDGTFIATPSSGAERLGVPATAGYGILFYPEATAEAALVTERLP